MTLLQQALDPANLAAAWDEVSRNRGMPGTDNLSIAAWCRDWEARLVDLSRRVRGGQYRPGKLRAIRVPKKDSPEWRTFRVPTVTDRVLQRAVLQVLMPFYETLFLDCSFGYRPNRSLKMALQRILSFRDQGRVWVLDADIDACFDSLDHTLLLDFLREDLPDDTLLGLITAWLTAAFPARPARGIPMGAPVSPLLANVYLHRLDLGLAARGRHVVRYADDFIVLTGHPNRLDDIYAETGELLARLKLAYEPAKTRLTSFDQGFEFIGVRFAGQEFTYTCKEKAVVIRGSDERWLVDEYLPEYE